MFIWITNLTVLFYCETLINNNLQVVFVAGSEFWVQRRIPRDTLKHKHYIKSWWIQWILLNKLLALTCCLDYLFSQPPFIFSCSYEMNRKDFLVLPSQLYHVQIVCYDCKQSDVVFSMNSALRSRTGKSVLDKIVCMFVRRAYILILVVVS